MVWYTAVQRIGSARTAVYSNLTPIVAMIVAAIWLGEQIDSARRCSAPSLILSGIAVTRLAPDGRSIARTPHGAAKYSRRRHGPQPFANREYSFDLQFVTGLTCRFPHTSGGSGNEAHSSRCAGGVRACWRCVPAPAFAQGGGASSTGTIQGRVTDASGGVLPGVTVTATEPVDDRRADAGDQRERHRTASPRCRPGSTRVTFELAGFTSVKRDGVEISLGFTANVNAEMAVATLQETVTVTGESPVIDTSATRVQQNFKLEQLNSIPNGRDMWALLAATPGVVMSRIDVGGNRAGTQTGYTAYGLNGQVRVSVEGINTTEGTGGAGFYFDYGSFEEVFLGVAGQGAEAATPGVQSQFLGKSGGNRFAGEFYVDGYNNSFQGSNLSEQFMKPTAEGGLASARQQRSAALLRRQHQRRRTDQAGQSLVPLLVAHVSSTRSNSRSSVRRRIVRHVEPEPVAQRHVSVEPEPQVRRLLPVEHEGPADASSGRRLHLRRRRRRPRDRNHRAGCGRASGTAR